MLFVCGFLVAVLLLLFVVCWTVGVLLTQYDVWLCIVVVVVVVVVGGLCHCCLL